MNKAAARTILITGCTRGCGRALTERFIEAGHTVLACGRSSELVQELTRQYGSPHHFAVVDVADDEQVEAWIHASMKVSAVPDLVINNAGIINRNAPLWEVPAGEFSQVIDVNIKGTASVMRHILPLLIREGHGVIVNVSSGWGRSTSPEVAPYCATKFAVEGLSQAVAEEVPRGIAVTAVNPGIIDTGILRSCWGKEAGAFPDPETWSRTAAPFLLALNASCNGRSLTITG